MLESRRSFLTRATTAATAVISPSRTLLANSASRDKLREFDYVDVKLTGGPLKQQFDRIYTSYLALDNDRLLKVYRQRAGLPAPGEDMGGWYDANGFVPGHSLGQYISGLARYARATRDDAPQAKARALIQGFTATLGSGGYPFASQKAATTWPCYILDKYEIGLLDAFQLAGITEARDVLPRIIRGALPFIPDHTYDRGPNSPKQAPYDEPYILSENLFNTYQATGDKAFLELAQKYLLNAEYFLPLAEGQNILPGKHAYSHVIALSSAAKAYQVLGDPRYLEAITNAWDMLESTQQYASGGWGPKEAFVEPHQGKLAASIASTHDHFETPCGCYAQMKLARYLLRFTANAKYGDGLERVLYNTLLGARDPDRDGDYFYYSDYHPNASKGYYHSKWPCCSGTLIQGVVDYSISAYFRASDGIYVNLFTPSEVKWSANGAPVRLTQTTNYPADGAVELRISTPKPLAFTMYVRMPGWLQQSPAVLVNGKALDGPTVPGTFASIRRKWKHNDTIQITFPLTARTEAIDDRTPELVALMRGPLMLVAVNPPADLSSQPLPLPQGLRSSMDSIGVECQTSGGTLHFRPFYTINNETYTTYVRKTSV